MSKHASTNEKLNALYDWIAEYMLDNGCPPRIAEIKKHFIISDTTARSMLDELHGLKSIEYTGPAYNRSYIVRGIYYVDGRDKGSDND